MSLWQTGFWRFAEFEIDLRHRRLTRAGAEVALADKGLTLLLAVIEHADRVVTRDELKAVGWPGAVAVEDGTVQQHVYEIRKALGDNARKPRFVRTVSTEGYRFIAPVRYIAEIDTLTEVPSPGLGHLDPSVKTPAQPRKRGFTARWTVGAALLGIVATLIVSGSIKDDPIPRVSSITKLTHDGQTKDSLVILDQWRLITSRYPDQRVIQVADGAPATPPLPSGYFVLDVSSRGEVVAVRPHDHGADQGLWVVPLRGGTPRRLGMLRANRQTAAWSHDARRISYALDNKLFVTDENGVASKELHAFSGLVGSQHWSQDDRFLRVTLRAFTERTVSQTLVDVDLSGAILRTIVDEGGENGVDMCCGAFLHNSGDFVFPSTRDGKSELWLLRQNAKVLGQQSPVTHQLATSALDLYGPRSGVDSNTLFVLGRTPPELVRVDYIRNEITPMLKGLNVLHLAFSPDRQHIVYVTSPEAELWRANPDGSNARLLLSDLQVRGLPAWSPDGKWLAFRAQASGRRAKAYIMPAVGGTPEPLDTLDVEQGIPSWSPDGAKLTFGDVPEHFGHATGSERVHIYDRATKTTTDVPGSERLWTSRWSPDGQYLAALTIEGQELKLFEFATNTWRSTGAKHLGNPTWSADSKYIYSAQEGPETWARRVRIADGKVERLVDLKNRNAEWVGVAPDGALLISRRLVDVYALRLDQ
jgi:DNA-binding winged helix-turn-helix (wHTH) protein/Tol biopolymer transport system component